MKQKIRWMAICLAAGLCGWPVGATTVTSLNTGETWAGNISGTATDLTLPTSSPWTTTDGFTFSSPSGSLSHASMGGTTYGLTTNGGQIDISTPAAGETAMWLNFGIYNINGYVDHSGSLAVTLSDSESFTVGNGPFWFSSSTPIASLDVTSNNASGDEPFVLDLKYATSSLTPGSGGGPSPVPEPATILLVSGGALALLGVRRRWLRREA